MFARTAIAIIVALLASLVFGLEIEITARQSGQAVQLHPGGIIGKCLDVTGNVRSDGTPVQIYDCNRSPAQNWIISHGSTQVRLSGTTYCLDASSTTSGTTAVKISLCDSSSLTQAWVYTNDLRIAIQGTALCLNDPDGKLSNGTPVGTSKCLALDTNQIWSVVTSGGSR